jgi:hypothetical protein
MRLGDAAAVPRKFVVGRVPEIGTDVFFEALRCSVLLTLVLLNALPMQFVALARVLRSGSVQSLQQVVLDDVCCDEWAQRECTEALALTLRDGVVSFTDSTVDGAALNLLTHPNVGRACHSHRCVLRR